MITELEIEGFKSFGSPAEKLRLGALNFVVGANASGKTNLLAALRFLQNAVMQNVDYAVNDLGGSSEVRNKLLRQRREPRPVHFRIKLDTPGFTLQSPENKTVTFEHFDYDIKIDLRSEGNVPVIESEALRVPLVYEDKKQVFILKRDTSNVIITDPLRSSNKKMEIPVPEQEATRLALGVGFFTLPCVILREEISDWRFYNISPHTARQPYREGPEVDLGPGGENLAVILHKIEQEQQKQDMNAIVSGLRSVVPGFKNIKTTQLPVEGKWAFRILEEKIRGAINPASISDGTIRLLTLLVITTWTAKHASLIAIEEPENGVHPHLSEHIVEILKTASKKHQCIITTHNPNFLDHLEPNEVILCDKKDGFTKLKHGAPRCPDQRYLFICVAIRELEAWFLADAPAIAAVLPGTQYNPPQDTAVLNAEVEIKSLWRQHYGNVACNKIDFAKRMAPKFSPTEAQQRSSSFTHFWTCITKHIRP